MKISNKARAKMKNNKKRKYIIAASLMVLIAAGSVGAFLLTRSNSKDSAVSSDTTYGKVDYSPANENDKEYNDNIKENIGNNNETPGNQAGTVPITIVDAAQYGDTIEVRAFASGVTENGGNCKYTFSKNGKNITKSTTASAGAQMTNCENLTVARNEFSESGTWSLKIEYSSSSSKGEITKDISIQ